MDLGEKNNEVCVFDREGQVIDCFMVGNTRKQFQKVFPQYTGAVVAIETVCTCQGPMGPQQHRRFDTANKWTMAGGVQPEEWPVWMRGFKDY